MHVRIGSAILLLVVVGAIAVDVTPRSWAGITAVCAGTAAIVNLHAAILARRDPDNVRAPVYWFIAAMATLYSVSWAVLALRGMDRATWSELMSPVAAFTFCSVWIVHALVVITRERKK